jgi:serine/threonine-protein kinase
VGTVFAEKYRLLRVLGAGGMGVVYEAEHLRLGRTSALKLLLARVSHKATAVARFQQEARRIARLQHPGIVLVHDAGHDTQGTPFIEMELLSGESLESMLERGALPPQRAAAIVVKALAALEVAHAAGVVHRDLKPDNLFLNGDTVKILDFGIAKSLEDDESVTKEGALLGTVLYMSPEQLTNAAGVDARADLYALGATLYRMLAGEPPLEPAATQVLIARILSGSVPRNPRVLRPEVPAWLDKIVARAMAPNPDERFATAREMRLAIERGQGPAETEVSAIDEPLAVSRVSAAGTAPPSVVQTAPAPVELPPVGSASPAAPATLASATAISPPPRRWTLVGLAGAIVVAGGAAAIIAGRGSRQDGTASSSVASVVAASNGAASASTGPVTPSARATPAPPPPGMVQVEGAALSLGIAHDDVDRVLTRCRSELALDPNDCTADKLARETQRTVTVPTFLLDDTEVTNERFVAWLDAQLVSHAATVDASQQVFLDGTLLAHLGTKRGGVDAPKDHVLVRPGFGPLPAVMVTWFGASAYCAAQSKRLPTEAEWELAARGSDAREFPWGGQPPTCAGVAFRGLAGLDCKIDGPSPVGTRTMDTAPSEAHDLGGNVMEWTADEDAALARGSRAVRGGSWFGSAFEARTTRRRFERPESFAPNLGFRCAKDAL